MNNTRQIGRKAIKLMDKAFKMVVLTILGASVVITLVVCVLIGLITSIV